MESGEAVRLLRRHRRMSQQAFATELGISMAALRNYESGRIPGLKAMLLLWNNAEEANRPDLCGVFRLYVESQVGKSGLELLVKTLVQA